MTKAKLFAELKFLPTEELRQETNKIIAKNRNLDIKLAKRKHYLRPNEVILIKTFFGVNG